jgi:hypothetical protein
MSALVIAARLLAMKEASQLVITDSEHGKNLLTAPHIKDRTKEVWTVMICVDYDAFLRRHIHSRLVLDLLNQLELTLK